MGAQGIRRRKPKRRLPPAQVPAEDHDIPPHIMWPDGRSGFEPSSWSPAGRSQDTWRFVQGLTRRDSRPFVTVILWAVLAVIALSVLGTLATLL